MPKQSQASSTTMDLSLLSNAVSAVKPAKPKKSKGAPTLPYGYQSITSPAFPGLEEGSETAAKKPKKDPMQYAQERIEKAMATAMDNVMMSVNQKLVTQAIKEKVRQSINVKFNNLLSPAEIDRFSSDAVRNATYELRDLKVIPAEYFNTAVLVPKEEQHTHTEEPNDDNEIEE